MRFAMVRVRYLIFVHIGVVFLHFLARASNGCQYSNFENKCPKLGTGTPEDMVLTNLGDSHDSDPSGFVLLHKICIELQCCTFFNSFKIGISELLRFL